MTATGRPSLVRRLTRWSVAGAALVALLVLGVLARLWMALPQLDGHLRMPGLEAAVEVVRDEFGIPHIRAATDGDLMAALGLVHAQDRLWQMEFQRRLGSGRLAEILGSRALPSDRFYRTLGLRRAADTAWPALSPRARFLVSRYVDGINYVIGSRSKHRLPIEFALFQFEPEPFTPVDVLLWPKVMALTLGTNFRDELLRTRLVARVGLDGAEALMPAYGDGWPVIVPPGEPWPPADSSPASPRSDQVTDRSGLEADRLVRIARLAETWPDLPGMPAGVAASNSWVVSGSRTVTGKPLLANDPHLGARLPSTWYLVHLEGGSIHAVGASLPGTPGIIIGHNGRVAWGLTNLMADVQDLYVERVNARGDVEQDGAWVRPRTVREVIRMRGGPDVEMTVRETRHGPIITDALDPPALETLALRWVALDDGDTTVDALFSVLTAHDWQSFTAALAAFRVPVQNWVYADVDGNIGYVAPGAIPVRAKGDGRLPVPGWTAEYEWAGWLAPDQQPRLFNPARGYIVTANNRQTADARADAVGTNWEAGYRAQRIIARLEATRQVDAEVMASIQGDVQSAQVAVLLPWLLATSAPVETPAARDALDRLRAWDGTFHADSAAAAVFMQWHDEVTTALFADDLGEPLWRDYRKLPYWLGKAMHRLVGEPEPHWCDDRRTIVVESCGALVATALERAVARLAAEQGRDPRRWRWGRQNEVVFAHLPLEAVAGLRRIFSRRAEHHGHFFTVSPTMRIQEQTVVASYRQIIDLADLDASRFIHPLGQSGLLLSGHYDDLHDRWRRVEFVPMRFSRASVESAARHRLLLEP